MDKPLVQLLKRTDLAGHVIAWDETRQWPAPDREAIFQLGLLRRVEDAEYVTCEVCPDAPYAEVVSEIGPEAWVFCGGCGLRRIPAERLQQWQVDFEALGRQVIAHLGLTGGVQTLVPGRIWLLGRRQADERIAEFFLIQGIDWPDSVDALRSTPSLAGSPAPVIVCPDRLPREAEWRESGRVFFRLSEWARLKGDLQIDFDVFADLYRQKAEAFDGPLTPTPPEGRGALLKRYCAGHNCTVAQICFWANVDRGDLSRWKNGNPLIPDGGDRANRIEKLLQRGLKTRLG